MTIPRFVKRIKAAMTILLILILPTASLLSMACKDDPIGPVLTDQDENEDGGKDGAAD